MTRRALPRNIDSVTAAALGLVLLGCARLGELHVVRALRAPDSVMLGAEWQSEPVMVQTRTVGRLEKKRCCSDLWKIDPLVTAAFARAGTWGELVVANRQSGSAVSRE
jgi:hypothetical protein